MRRNLLFILALLLGMATLHAKPVEVAKAQRLGLNFVQHKAMFAKNAVQDMQLAYIHHADNGMATMYVFNFDGGYVIVSADDSSSPILGYSNEGNFAYETAPAGLRFMLDELSRGISTVVENGRPVSATIVARWKNLDEYGFLHAGKSHHVVEPLIQQRWDQGYPFNMYAPDGCPTGCVATAMAQIMKFWEWPITGTGDHSYNSSLYGEQYANFGATTYDWANMIDYYGGGATQAEKEAVATLMYHCGVSVDMEFEHSGSGAFSGDVPGAINNYFSYSDHATFVSKGSNYDEWISLLKSNLDQRIPLYYSGQGTDGGHAFVCDGYDEDGLFHFNFGWGGSSNSFLLIDGEEFEYTGYQGVVVDFVPDHIFNAMPQAPDNLAVNIDSDVSLSCHLSWTNPTHTETGDPLTSLDKVVVLRDGFIVHEIENVQPGQTMTCDDEVPFFDQYDYAILAVNGKSNGRTAHITAVFGPYCDWTVIMTSSDFHGWNGGGITIQNAAGSYIDFLTTNTSAPTLQKFPMALGNNNLYWTEPSVSITNLSFKVKDALNHVIYEYSGPSSELESGLLRTLNNTCDNEFTTCEAPYNLKAEVDPDNDQTIILTWESDHAPEFGYCIYRDGLLFNMSHELTYIDENTDIGGHRYYVTALCSSGETESSNEYSISSGSDCEPPLDFYYFYTSDNRLRLTWSPTGNNTVSGYLVYRKSGDDPYKRVKLVSANNTSFTDPNAVPYTEYQYVVEAYYRANDCTSAYANDLFDPQKFFINVDWSNTPNDLQVSFNEMDTMVKLRWKPAYMATSYDILRNGEIIGEATGMSFEDLELEQGETYCYQVIAHGDGFDTNSNEACITMPEPPTPPVLLCPSPMNLRREDPLAQVHIAWDAPAERAPENYTVVVIDHMLNDTIEISGITDLFLEQDFPVDLTDKSYKVKAVYPECESEFALTLDGEDHVRVTNLSVEDNMLLKVKLYPNPTFGQLNIKADGMTSASVYDLVGQCVMQMSAQDGQASVDMSRMKNGVYFIKVKTSNGSAIQRVVKM